MEEQLQTEIAIRRDVMDDVMVFLEEKHPDLSLADVAVNLKVLSEVIAENIGMIIEQPSSVDVLGPAE